MGTGERRCGNPRTQPDAGEHLHGRCRAGGVRQPGLVATHPGMILICLLRIHEQELSKLFDVPITLCESTLSVRLQVVA